MWVMWLSGSVKLRCGGDIRLSLLRIGDLFLPVRSCSAHRLAILAFASARSRASCSKNSAGPRRCRIRRVVDDRLTMALL
jgi:hypothetical protein